MYLTTLITALHSEMVTAPALLLHASPGPAPDCRHKALGSKPVETWMASRALLVFCRGSSAMHGSRVSQEARCNRTRTKVSLCFLNEADKRSTSDYVISESPCAVPNRSTRLVFVDVIWGGSLHTLRADVFGC